jgi:hypothetical protein
MLSRWCWRGSWGYGLFLMESAFQLLLENVRQNAERQRPSSVGDAEKEAHAGPRTCGRWCSEREPRQAFGRLLRFPVSMAPALLLSLALASPIVPSIVPALALLSARGATRFPCSSFCVPTWPTTVVIRIPVSGAAHARLNCPHNVQNAVEEGVDQCCDDPRRFHTHPNGRGKKDRTTQFKELVVGRRDELGWRWVDPFRNKALQFEEV